MKIILTSDVKKVGKKGEIITVKDGYGNFLIKANKAVLATNYGVDRLNKENELNKQQELETIKELTKVKEKIEKEKIEFKVKTGTQDRVFGSISPKQIVEKLTSLGYKIDKKQIETNTSLSSLGFHKVTINLHKKVQAIITINLVK